MVSICFLLSGLFLYFACAMTTVTRSAAILAMQLTVQPIPNFKVQLRLLGSRVSFCWPFVVVVVVVNSHGLSDFLCVY